MEYLSSTRNNQDTQSAQEEDASSPEVLSQHVRAGIARRDGESDFIGSDTSSQPSRKKQKLLELNENQAHIEKLQQEITEVKKRLASPQRHSLNSAHGLGKKCIEAKQTAATMKRKLAEHSHWLQRVSSLMQTAPLFFCDYAVGAGGDNQQSKEAEGKSKLQRNLDGTLDGKQSKDRSYPRLILGELLRAAVDVCQNNASRLLRDATENAPSFQLSLKFESHGWEIAAGTLLNGHMGFRCHRVLPAELGNKAKEVAMALWNFVERDEIFRTFVPLVQDSIITHKEKDCSLSCRVLQLSQEMNQQAVATVEAIRSTQENSWQISMEAVHDHSLCTFVADASADAVSQNTAPPVKLDLGLQMSKLNMHNNFVMGARVTETDEGVDIFVAGSARFDLPSYRDPAFDLLQHFVSHLPVYEDLHLTPLNECQDKAASHGINS